ncbi:hypothetical protein PoB_007174200 [Plakobranchus ocellatus]|uniref:Uncharacterized protein n=1 Tax=Plakobranchus ocellatus TaxID=259542 RepID=A0AAV4DLU5_9GAST|nr:hypothetical protein PoB_007174200 [Plakobranchus ocellatus]
MTISPQALVMLQKNALSNLCTIRPMRIYLQALVMEQNNAQNNLCIKGPMRTYLQALVTGATRGRINYFYGCAVHSRTSSHYVSDRTESVFWEADSREVIGPHEYLLRGLGEGGTGDPMDSGPTLRSEETLLSRARARGRH